MALSGPPRPHRDGSAPRTLGSRKRPSPSSAVYSSAEAAQAVAPTDRRYIATRKPDGSPAPTTWRTFPAGPASELSTMELTTQPLWGYSS
jgi:hypothetical protein